MQKPVGVLTETGGVADELSRLCQKITKEGEGSVLFDSNPEKLIENIINRLTQIEYLQ